MIIHETNMMAHKFFTLVAIGAVSAAIFCFYSAKKKKRREIKHNHFYKIVFFPDKGLRNSEGSSAKEDSGPLYCDSHIKGTKLSATARSLQLRTSTSLVHLVDVLDSAKYSIDVCVLLITSEELANALVRAKNRGVNVRIVTDHDMSKDGLGCKVTTFMANNIPVIFSPKSVMMHNKFAIVDACHQDLSSMYCHSLPNKNSSASSAFITNHHSNNSVASMTDCSSVLPCGPIVMLGSFNWTGTAVTANYESVIITNHPEVVGPISDEFEQLWKIFQSSI